ncbi:hypothetical protein KGM_214104 [Danaus plexippus plexippus]|uniref:Uncharacterized protein n=1 Tax=Danaus plexippus plexippus TaxID=278856 RepID=A0A212EQD2_DANPL|nr:hypothetical protein KGM_214104 [Danaus plexippus plexippus]
MATPRLPTGLELNSQLNKLYQSDSTAAVQGLSREGAATVGKQNCDLHEAAAARRTVASLATRLKMQGSAGGGWRGGGVSAGRHWSGKGPGGPQGAGSAGGPGGAAHSPPPAGRPPHNARSLRAVRSRARYHAAHRRESM